MPPISKVEVKGVGAYLPGKKIATRDIQDYLGAIPGADMSKYHALIDRFIGIRYRHYAIEKGTERLLEDSSVLAAKAARVALERSGLESGDIDLIVAATSTPPYLRPGLAKDIRLHLGIPGCTTYDLWGACTGIQQAITIATGGIRGGLFRNALLVGVELTSTTVLAGNYASDKVGRHDLLLRGVGGDGAGAMVLGAANGGDDGILYTGSGTEGEDASAFHREAGGSTTPFNREAFEQGLHHWQHDFERIKKSGRTYFVEIIRRVLGEIDLPIEQVGHIVPAAANFGYFMTEEFFVGMASDYRAFCDQVEKRIFTNYASVGNIPSAAIYVAMNELYEQDKLATGAILVLPSVEGATWGWGATVMRWPR